MFGRLPFDCLRRSVRQLLVPMSLCGAAFAASAVDLYPPPTATNYPINSLSPVAAPSSVSVSAAQPQYLNPIQLHELVARIALYPDDLISIILPASTVPLQIVQAARYLEAVKVDPSLQPDNAWEDAVVALLNYPDVIAMMDRDLTWTERLGTAVVQQQAEVITAVSQFRAQAQQAGNLQSDERQIVEADQGAIRIRPADPQIIYVPQYEPAQVLVYQPAPVLRYYPRPCPVYYYPYDRGYPSGFPYFWGVSSAFSIGWRTHSVHVREHDHYDHAYYDNPYRGHYYRRRHHGHDGDQYYAYDRDHHQDYGRDDGNHGNESGRHDSHERRDHPRGERPDRGREYVWEPSRGRGGHLQQSRPRTIATTGHPTMLGNVGTTDPRNITLAPFLGGQRTEPQLPLRPSARARGAEAAITERRALPRNLGIVGPQAPSMPRQVRELDPAPNARDSSLNGREVSVTAMRPPASGIMIPSTSSSGYQPPRVPPAHDAQPGRRVGQSTPAFVIPHTSRVPQPTRGLDRTRTRPVIASDNRPLAAAPTRVPASGIMVPGTSVGGYAPQQVPSRREALPERRARAAEVEIPRGYSMPVPVERPIFESRSESPSQRDFSRAAPRVSRPDVRTDSARAWNGMRQATERRMTERRRER